MAPTLDAGGLFPWFRGELIEVVDAEFLLEAGDLLDDLFEPALSEQLVLLLLELLAEFLDVLCGQNFPKGGE